MLDFSDNPIAPRGFPFDAIRTLIADMPQADEEARAHCQARLDSLVKPQGSLGRLEELVCHLAAWQGSKNPSADRAFVALFAGTHGVTKHGVSPYPSEVTKTMVEVFAAGGGAINQIAAQFGIGLKVFDLALDIPTGDIATEAALDEAACVATMAFGMEAVSGNTELLCLGEMGIGNTTIAAALSAALFGGEASDWVGQGTGAPLEMVAHKAKIVQQALNTHEGHLHDPLEALRRLGGRELAAIAGAILAARHQRIPVLLDGYIVTAAAAVLYCLREDALDHCIAAHVSAEKGHQRLLEKMNLKPLHSLDMRLGEGTGAALAVSTLQASVACYRGMVTLQDIGIFKND